MFYLNTIFTKLNNLKTKINSKSNSKAETFYPITKLRNKKFYI